MARPVERAGAIAARALENGHRLLVAVGSDRLAHALLRVLVDPSGPRWPDAVLGLAGLGRQDLSATFGLPDDPASWPFLVGPNLFTADVGRARWRGRTAPPGSGCSPTPPSSATRPRCRPGPRPGGPGDRRDGPPVGRGPGGSAGWPPSAALRPPASSTPARLEVDHTAVDLRLAGLVVANGQFTMGRMKVAPRALPDDGRLSVIAFQGEPLGIYSAQEPVLRPARAPPLDPRVPVAPGRRRHRRAAGPGPTAGGPPAAPVSIDVMEQALRVKV